LLGWWEQALATDEDQRQHTPLHRSNEIPKI
jgi:hypothetical protein